MQQFLFVVLAVFWGWATLRYALESFVPSVFYASRVVHPLVVAAGTSYLCYPDLVRALAAAGAVGILVALMDRFLSSDGPAQAIPQRSRMRGLPPLP